MTTFFQGQNATFFANFVDGASSPITQGISGVNITMYHYLGPTQIFDVAPTPMTPDPMDLNRYYYTYQFQTNAATTDYIAVYNAIFSGIAVQSTEVNNLLPGSTTIPGSIITGGSVSASGIVVDPSGISISGAQVYAVSGNTLFASTTTDASGTYAISINPGFYLFTYQASGFFTNQQFETIPSGATFNLGYTVLNYNTVGSLNISDSVLAPNPLNPVQNIPVPNLKVTLFSIGDVPNSAVNISVNYDNALQTTYTNVSGVWVMQANPGYYILDFEGMRYNAISQQNERFKLTRNIEVNTMYSSNFDYLDTSKAGYL